MEPPAELTDLLQPTATVDELIRGLLGIGLQAKDIAAAVRVSPSTLRNWTSGQGRPRSEAEFVLDDLRATVKVLLDGGLPAARAARWLKARDPERFDDRRPIEWLAADPTRVLRGAHHEVLDEEITQAKERQPKLVPSSAN